jgi:hypothetical protein
MPCPLPPYPTRYEADSTPPQATYDVVPVRLRQICGDCRMDLPGPTTSVGYQDRLLGGPLGLPDLRCTAPDGVKHKDYRGEVLG